MQNKRLCIFTATEGNHLLLYMLPTCAQKISTPTHEHKHTPLLHSHIRFVLRVSIQNLVFTKEEISKLIC